MLADLNFDFDFFCLVYDHIYFRKSYIFVLVTGISKFNKKVLILFFFLHNILLLEQSHSSENRNKKNHELLNRFHVCFAVKH